MKGLIEGVAVGVGLTLGVAFVVWIWAAIAVALRPWNERRKARAFLRAWRRAVDGTK